MPTQIKITQLTNIGSANTTVTTLLPVVNMAGTPTTQKTTLGNLANVILSQSGGNYAPANLANIAYSVANAAQPNITSVGTLTNLAVSGNATVNGNITSNGTAYVGNLSTTGLASITTLSVGATANLGAVGNVKITGGTDGYVLQTDGTGNLSWTAQTGGGGNGVPGGSNTQVQFNDAGSFGGNTGFTFNKTTGIFTSPFIAGNGNGLSNIQVANVSGLGNIATANLTGSNSNVLYGNGVFAPIAGGNGTYGNADVATFLAAYGSNTMTTTGNISVGNIISNGTIYIGNTTISQVNPIVLGFNNDIYVGGDVLSDRVKSNTGTVALNASNSTANTEWAFNVNGTLNLPQPRGNTSTSIQSIYSNSSSFIDFVSNNSANFTFGTDGNNNLVFIAGLREDDYRWVMGYDGTLTFPGNARIASDASAFEVQNANAINFEANSVVNIYTDTSNNAYQWQFGDDGSMIFPTLTVDLHNGGEQSAQTLQFGDNTQQAVITGPTPDADTNAQRLIIQGQRGSGTGEGGDVYVWAGDSDTAGGDIKIYAGDADSNTSGAGGYINLAGGDGFDNGGAITINGGISANSDGGSVSMAGGQGQVDGGPVNIQGGYGATSQGGQVNILGGSAGGGQSAYGNVVIGSGTQAWSFNNAGNLVLPGNTFAVNYANGTQVNISGGGGNTGNVTFDDVTIQGVNVLNLSAGPDFTANLAYLQLRAGDVASHIHLETGNATAYDLIIGDDQKYVQVSSTGDIIMSSYDGNTSYIWTFDQEGNLILAGGESAIQSVANSSLDPLNPNVSTMILTPSRGYSSQSLVLDPTAPGHIHLRAPSANIDEPLANIFLGGEESSFEVGYYNGSAPNVFVHSGNNTWTFDTIGSLNLPTLSLGAGVDEQTIIQSQRKIIPPFRYSVQIDGAIPTVVYTATDNSITSMKVTMQIQHTGLGMEFFEVYATYTGPDTYYTVSNRIQPPTITNSGVVVSLNGSNAMEITVNINSNAANCWVTYDATEFGISVD